MVEKGNKLLCADENCGYVQDRDAENKLSEN